MQRKLWKQILPVVSPPFKLKFNLKFQSLVQLFEKSENQNEQIFKLLQVQD